MDQESKAVSRLVPSDVGNLGSALDEVGLEMFLFAGKSRQRPGNWHQIQWYSTHFESLSNGQALSANVQTLTAIQRLGRQHTARVLGGCLLQLWQCGTTWITKTTHCGLDMPVVGQGIREKADPGRG